MNLKHYQVDLSLSLPLLPSPASLTGEVDHFAGGFDAFPHDEVDHDPGEKQRQDQPPLRHPDIVDPRTDAQDVVSADVQRACEEGKRVRTPEGQMSEQKLCANKPT